MVQLLGAVLAHAEDLGWMPSSTWQLTTIRISVAENLMLSSDMGTMHPCGTQIHMQMKHPYA